MARCFPLILLSLAAIWTSTARAAEPKVEKYADCCDASAAVALGADHFVVGDDESNILRIFKRGEREPVESVQLGAFLHSRGNHTEADIEGAARIGDVIYWITSHSMSKEGKDRAARHRFFATQILGENSAKPSVKPIGAFPRNLLEAFATAPTLREFDLIHAAGTEPKEPGGLSIEGLSATANGTLLIGFRNPIPKGSALVVEMLNPREVVDGAEPKFGASHLLALGGLGIRDMFFDGREYLISAGPYNGKGAFQIYRWAGDDTAPEPLRARIASGFHPEAIFRFPGGKADHVCLLSDDGKLQKGGVRCNELPAEQRAFRFVELKLKNP